MLTANWGRQTSLTPALAPDLIRAQAKCLVGDAVRNSKWEFNILNWQISARAENCLINEFEGERGLPQPRCQQVMASEGLDWLLDKTPKELLRIPNFGRMSLSSLREAMEEMAGGTIQFDMGKPLRKAVVLVGA